jgi:putative tryptophan/tyrosine transport system substrate-binding protein
MRTWRGALACATVVALALVSGACGGDDGGSTATSSSARTYTIAVAEFAEIPPILQAVDGFKATLAARGYREGDRVRYVVKSAQGQTNNASLVARQIVQQKPDLIYAIGTPLVIALMQQTKSIPILFGAMTDPVGSGVIKNVQRPGGDLSGTSDFISAKVFFDLFGKVVPNVKRVGVLANQAEANSQAALKDLRREADARGIALKVAAVSNTGAVVPALSSLRGKVDVVTFPTDNTVISALPTVVRTATNMGLPVVAATTDTATKGGLVGVGANYRSLGEIGGGQAADVISGKTKIGDLPAYYPRGKALAIAVNANVARRLGIPPERLPAATAG